MRTTVVAVLLALGSVAAACGSRACGAGATSSVSGQTGKTLDIYFIDVEGGQATLLVTPRGRSLLIDTGWPDANGRDAERIGEAARLADVKQIDFLVITHYHMDHVGGVPQLAALLPIRNFVDHGPSVEHGKDADALLVAYEKEREKGNHTLAHPGQKLWLDQAVIEILTAAGQEITQPLPGAGESNPLCASTERRPIDTSENAQSVGLLISFGKFRMIDLGDLTWNKELELVCPQNLIGTVDVYLSTHHGMNLSGSPAIVHALHPRVAIMNNGARKGGSPEAWQAIRTSPGLEDIWQLHYALAGGKEHNAPEDFIANLQEEARAHWIKLSASADGQFTVTNSRNGMSKSYRPGGEQALARWRLRRLAVGPKASGRPGPQPQYAGS
jgi:beta-lactamase superfamily II metal-dependent hydrolase